MVVTRDNIISIVKNPALLNEETLDALHLLVNSYPWFQTARILYLKNLIILGREIPQEELQTTALFCSSRARLYDYLAEEAKDFIQNLQTQDVIGNNTVSTPRQPTLIPESEPVVQPELNHIDIQAESEQPTDAGTETMDTIPPKNNEIEIPQPVQSTINNRTEPIAEHELTNSAENESFQQLLSTSEPIEQEAAPFATTPDAVPPLNLFDSWNRIIGGLTLNFETEQQDDTPNEPIETEPPVEVNAEMVLVEPTISTNEIVPVVSEPIVTAPIEEKTAVDEEPIQHTGETVNFFSEKTDAFPAWISSLPYNAELFLKQWQINNNENLPTSTENTNEIEPAETKTGTINRISNIWQNTNTQPVEPDPEEEIPEGQNIVLPEPEDIFEPDAWRRFIKPQSTDDENNTTTVQQKEDNESHWFESSHIETEKWSSTNTLPLVENVEQTLEETKSEDPFPFFSFLNGRVRREAELAFGSLESLRTGTQPIKPIHEENILTEKETPESTNQMPSVEPVEETPSNFDAVRVEPELKEELPKKLFDKPNISLHQNEAVTTIESQDLQQKDLNPKPIIETDDLPILPAITDYFSQIHNEAPKPQEGIDPDSELSFTQWLEVLNKGVSAKDKQKQIVPDNMKQAEQADAKWNLIDKFIESGKTNISNEPEPEQKPISEPEPEKPVQKTLKQSRKESGSDFFTETLAKIYIKQKQYSKAIGVLEKLSLKFPEKSIYFAGQIKIVTELMLNDKK